MFLSDTTIMELIENGTILIEPYDPALIQPCSIDVRLGSVALASFGKRNGFTCWTINPHQFVLGSTLERIRLPPHIAATVSGKSTTGRRGLAVHITAGHVDPGFDGELTLELCNVSDHEISIVQGDAIGQLIFTYLDRVSENPYNGRYQGQRGPTPPRPKKYRG